MYDVYLNLFQKLYKWRICRLLFPAASNFFYGTVIKDVYKDFIVLIETHTNPEYYNNDLLFFNGFWIYDLKYLTLHVMIIIIAYHFKKEKTSKMSAIRDCESHK